MSAPVIITYYGQTRAFTYTEISNGTFEAWLNTVYADHVAAPCDEVFTSVTTTSTTNLTTNIINTVLNLSTVTNITSLSTNLGSTVNTGSSFSESGNSSNSNDNNNQNSSNGSQGTSGTSSSSSNSSNGSSSSSSNGTSSGSGSTGSSSGSGSGSGGNSGSNGSGSGSNSGGGNGGGSGSGTDQGTNPSGTGSGGNKGGVQNGSEEGSTPPTQEEIAEVKEDQAKSDAQQTSKSTSKSKTQTQKPAILVTGDIVGLQTAEDKSQDARGTFSYTRVKGDGTASFGISADYMINAKISNITFIKSWIGVKENGSKHINMVSSGMSFQPGAWSNTTMLIRVNSLKNFTSIYGGAVAAGYLYEEPMISTIAVVGMMYKGKLTRNIDGTVIAAAVYSPYSLYYTESWFESLPIVVPFFNINYKMTKTFGVGITGGGTYSTNFKTNSAINYQLLFGAKLII